MRSPKTRSRRDFIRTGSIAALGWAAGCAAPTTVTPAPTAAPKAKSTTQAAKPTPIHTQPARADLLAHYPQTSSSPVSLVRHEGAWDGDRVREQIALEMLDAALVELTGIGDAAAAWSVLFDPGETVGIKVNTISRYTTTPEVTYAVAQRLREAGLKPSQIVIFDRMEQELVARGYTINVTGPGVRCQGAMAWKGEEQVAGTTQRVHNIARACDALINIPALKSHDTAGFTSALKNHYGTIHNPQRLHAGNCNPAIPELNALPVIRDRTRLVIGDFIRICPYNWRRMSVENLIAMSFDPVALDAVARQVLVERREADGRPAGGILAKSGYLETAIEMGLGAGLGQVDLRQTTLG
jgi:hypothetical protein